MTCCDPHTACARPAQTSAQNGAQTGNQTVTQADRVIVQPVTDVYQTAEHFEIHAELPGVKAESIEVSVDRGVLTLRAPAPARRPERSLVLREETGRREFCRAFRLSGAVDASKIDAEFKDGVLKLRLAKAESARPRTIRVQPA